MSDSMDKAIGQLKDMLSTEEGQKEIEGILEEYSNIAQALPLRAPTKGPLTQTLLCGLKTLWTKFNRTTTREFSFLHRSGRI